MINGFLIDLFLFKSMGIFTGLFLICGLLVAGIFNVYGLLVLLLFSITILYSNLPSLPNSFFMVFFKMDT